MCEETTRRFIMPVTIGLPQEWISSHIRWSLVSVEMSGNSQIRMILNVQVPWSKFHLTNANVNICRASDVGSKPWNFTKIRRQRPRLHSFTFWIREGNPFHSKLQKPWQKTKNSWNETGSNRSNHIRTGTSVNSSVANDCNGLGALRNPLPSHLETAQHWKKKNLTDSQYQVIWYFVNM